MSSATYSPTTTREEAIRSRTHVVTNDKKFNPTLSQLLGLDGESWWNSAEIKTGEEPPSWIWFHLPAVNKGWLSDLIWKLQTKGMIPRRESDYEEGRNGVVSFLHETFSGKRIVELPRFNKSNESGDFTFSIAMNFLDSEDSGIYHKQDNKLARRRLAQIDLGDPDGRSLLISHSLDESFSVTTGDEDDLNHDQVVSRYYKYYRAGKLSDGREDEESKRKRGVATRILMVSPLRLWKIGRDVVITAFPANYNENFNPQFTTFGNVHQSVMRSQPQNAMELVSKIMASLVTIVDAPYYAGLNESLLAMFEFDTSAQMAKQLDIFKKFQQMTRGGGESQPSSALESITSEVECFRVIMDIRDELAMVSSVFSEQERAIHTAMRTFEKLMKDPAANVPRDQLNEAELGIALWVKRLSNVDQRAQVVEKALGHLLNLKLEVSNLAAAEGTKKLLESSHKQSNYLFAFTVVTVIYAPLSFVTSFFAIPSRDFPQDGGVSWSQRQIGGGLAISLVVTIVLAVLPIVLKRLIERNRNAKKKKKDEEKKRMEEERKKREADSGSIVGRPRRRAGSEERSRGRGWWRIWGKGRGDSANV